MNRFNKQKTINAIVYDFNEGQSKDSYYFENSGIDITWSRDREVYLILNKNGTWKYSSPSNLISYIEDLTTKDLKEYFTDEMDCEYFEIDDAN
tara:strand:- start:188 stop:466 length:279 start_codon:yes stop_codon:yes gene_type:complete